MITPIFIDFETYWSKTHSLSAMSPMAYVTHPDTQLISMSMKVGIKGETTVDFGEAAIRKRLGTVEWGQAYAIAHNMSEFDAMLLAWRLGVRPRFWGCTLAMARPIHAKTTGLSLAKLVAHYADELQAMGINPVKDNKILLNTQGKRLEDFNAEELKAMARYNADDTEQCGGLFRILAPMLPRDELFHLDCNIRMLVEPQFVVDRQVLLEALTAERRAKRQAIMDVARLLRPQVETTVIDVTDGPEYEDDNFWLQDEDEIAEFVRAELASAPKLAKLLEDRGVEVPMKPSPTNPDKQVPAFARTDEAFVAMQEHDDPLVAAAARARLAVKSTLLETRIESFLEVSEAVNGLLPVPLKYSGADTTGRDSGWAYNPQNLPRITPGKPKTSDALRNSLRAPQGYVVGVADQSGIELRVNHTLWKVPSTMALYQADPLADLYKDFAAFYYDKSIDEVSKTERQFAKVCIAEGQLVLTHNGLKPIESVSVLDLVWDGVEWVSHDGPAYMGEKETIFYDGLEATPDHEVWVKDGRKVPLWFAAAQLLRLARTGDSGLPVGFVGAAGLDDHTSQGLQIRECPVHGVRGGEADGVRQFAQAHLYGVYTVRAEVRSADVAAAAPGGRPAAVHEPQRSGLPALRGAGDQVRVRVSGGSRGLGDGEPGSGAGEGAGQDRQQPGVCPGEPALGDATAEHGEPAALACAALPQVSGSAPGSEVCGRHTQEPNLSGPDGRGDCCEVPPPVVQAKRRVWDLLNAGPRHRFTVSNVLVANCQLGLGFGAGAKTFMRVARLMGGIRLDAAQSESAVTGWRNRYEEIVGGWRTCGEALNYIAQGLQRDVDPWGMVHTDKHGLVLPSGRIIRYPDLRYVDTGETWDDGRPKKSWVYASGRHQAYLTGPKVDENIVQALARDSVFECALRFYCLTGLRPVMRVHDELIYIFPASRAAELLELLQKTMRTPPSFWPDLIVWSEGDTAPTYGHAKT